MSLLELPLDILLLVTDYVGVSLCPYRTTPHGKANSRQITNKTDLKHLSEVCKHIYYHVAPILYKSVTVQADHEVRMHKIVASLLQARNEPKSLLRYTRSVQVECQLHQVKAINCAHSDTPDYTREKEGKEWVLRNDLYRAFNRRFASLMHFLEELEDNSLRDFRWEMAQCVPIEILGPAGYLARKQRQIECIRLITDPTCDSGSAYDFPVDLSAFQNLKSISWKGPRTEPDFVTLGQAIENNKDQLLELELDLFDWHEMFESLEIEEDHTDLHHFFFHGILALHTDDTRIMFPALQVLSLSAIDLRSAERELTRAFDINLLQSLKLRLCPGWEKFLECLASSGCPVRLQTLEVQSSERVQDSDGVEELSAFVNMFQGLRELFISINGPVLSLDILRSAICHKSTLRRFVYQVRSMDLEDESATFGELFDLADLSLLREDVTELENSPSQNPFSQLDLECIGICCDPKFARTALGPHVSKSTLELIHIRQSGSDLKYVRSWGVDTAPARNEVDACTSDEDLSSHSNGSRSISRTLHDFANWAFGSEGIRSLRVIAFGDFSYEGRYWEGNVILGRANESIATGAQVEPNYRLVDKDNQLHMEPFEKYLDVLEACPSDSLLEF